MIAFPQATLRPVYSTHEFASEILDGKRTYRWVADQCRARKIKTIRTAPHAPFLIPNSEAQRFLGSPAPRTTGS